MRATKGALRTLAHLFERTEAGTPGGGRVVGWEPVGDLWLAAASPLRNVDGGADQPPVTRERSLAETRSDPRSTSGMRVDERGREWRVVHVDPDTPRMGRMTLTLERDL